MYPSSVALLWPALIGSSCNPSGEMTAAGLQGVGFLRIRQPLVVGINDSIVGFNLLEPQISGSSLGIASRMKCRGVLAHFGCGWPGDGQNTFAHFRTKFCLKVLW
jgi:hypothetical protein